MTSHYQKQIITVTGCTEAEAKGVEARLRLIYGTLDGLGYTLTREAKAYLPRVRADPQAAADLAKSYGL